MGTIRAFFPKSGHFPHFSEKGRGGLHPIPPSCAPATISFDFYHRDSVAVVLHTIVKAT